MICSVRWLIAATASTAALLAFASAYAWSNTQDRGWDTEISCCFLYDDFRDGREYDNAFVVKLTDMGHHVAEMRLTTPSGAVLGFDEKTGRYTMPDPKVGAYGLLVTGGGIDMLTVDAEWSNDADHVFVFNPVKGQYTLQVIGKRDDKYILTFYPMGLPRPGQPGSLMRFDTGTGYVPIKAGEIHSYVFPGEFDRVNTTLGPNRFYWKRVK